MAVAYIVLECFVPYISLSHSDNVAIGFSPKDLTSDLHASKSSVLSFGASGCQKRYGDCYPLPGDPFQGLQKGIRVDNILPSHHVLQTPNPGFCCAVLPILLLVIADDT